MGRKNNTKKAEEVLDPKEGVAENVTGEEAEKDTLENASAEKAEAKIAPAKETPVAVAEADSGKVTVVMPRFLFTSDVDVTHHEVVYMGKIYQVQYDVPVEVPTPVADIIKNAIAQKEKVRGLIKSLSGKAKEISNE